MDQKKRKLAVIRSQGDTGTGTKKRRLIKNECQESATEESDEEDGEENSDDEKKQRKKASSVNSQNKQAVKGRKKKPTKREKLIEAKKSLAALECPEKPFFPVSTKLANRIAELRQLTQEVMDLDPTEYKALGGLIQEDCVTPAVDQLFKKNSGYFWSALACLNQTMAEKLLYASNGSLTVNTAATFVANLSSQEDQDIFLRASAEMLVPYTTLSEKRVEQDLRHLYCIVAKMWLLAFGDESPLLKARKAKAGDCSCEYTFIMGHLQRSGTDLKVGPHKILISAKARQIVVEIHRGHCPSCQVQRPGVFYWKMPLTIQQMMQDLGDTLAQIKRKTECCLEWLPKDLVNIINLFLVKEKVKRKIPKKVPPCRDSLINETRMASVYFQQNALYWNKYE